MFTSIPPASKPTYLPLGPWKDFSSPLCSPHFNHTSCSQRNYQWHHVRVLGKLSTIPRASLSSLMSTGRLWHHLLQRWFVWTLTEPRPCRTVPHSPDYIFPVWDTLPPALPALSASPRRHTLEKLSPTSQSGQLVLLLFLASQKSIMHFFFFFLYIWKLLFACNWLITKLHTLEMSCA